MSIIFSASVDAEEKLIKNKVRFWEKGNEINEDGYKIRDTAYYPEENLEFDSNGE